MKVLTRSAPSFVEPRKLLKFLSNVNEELEEPADTSPIFIKDALGKFCFWADSDEYPEKSVLFKIALWVLHISYAILTTSMWTYLFITKMDLFKFVDVLCYTIAALQLTGKTFFIQYYRAEITFLINTLNKKGRELLEISGTNQEVKKLRNGYYYIEMMFTVAFMVMGSITALIPICRIFLPLPPKLPSNAVYPFDTTPMGWGFIVAYIFESITYFLSGIEYGLVDAVIGCNYNQVILHFEVLGVKLRSLGYIEKEQFKNQPTEFNAACYRNLHSVIEEYGVLERLTNLCNNMLKSFFRFLVVATMIQFIFMTFTVTVAIHKDLAIFFTFLAFLSYIASCFFFWCFLGNRLKEKSDLSNDAYLSNWVECDRRFKIDLLRFMIRAQKPLEYHAKPFVVFNFEMFSSITSKAFSYFAVLQDLSSK